MLGVLIDSLAPESHAKSIAEISPARPRYLSAVFSSISAALTLSRTPSRSQGRSQSQESADIVCTPSRSNSRVSQASGNTTEQTTDDTDSPTPQRPRRNTTRTQLYQSSEEAHKRRSAVGPTNAHHAKLSTPLTIGGVVTGLTEPRVLADLRPKKSPKTSSTPISMAPNDECFVVSEDLIDSI